MFMPAKRVKNMMPKTFAVFILTHGRANNVYTYQSLRKQGYTGKIYLICDDEDKQLDKYKEVYGKESVIVFNKQEAIDFTDSGDNFKKRNSVVYARNISFDIASSLGLTHFWQLDDDYTRFDYSTNEELQYITSENKIGKLDDVLVALIEFLDTTPFHSVAFAQGGDFIGGEGCVLLSKMRKDEIYRKVMNSFMFRVDRRVKFMGRINEDVNMYAEWGRRGILFMTTPQLRLQQIVTQQNEGGLTEIYLDLGTYTKSFYSVMYAPSCVKISEVGTNDKRIHHQVSWKHTAPKILSEEHRKPRVLSRITSTVK
jgi:hypothetical protein